MHKKGCKAFCTHVLPKLRKRIIEVSRGLSVFLAQPCQARKSRGAGRLLTSGSREANLLAFSVSILMRSSVMKLQEKSTGRAVCSAVVQGFDGSFPDARPVRRGAALPFEPVLSCVARSAFARVGSVSGGSVGRFHGVFSPASAGIRDWMPGRSIGKFADGTEDRSSSIGVARRKNGTTAGKRLQFSGGWGKRRQQYGFTPKEVTQMLGDQERRCARFDAGFEKIINATGEAFRDIMTGDRPCELKIEQQSLREE